MTEQEAIKVIVKMHHHNYSDEMLQAIELAVNALTKQVSHAPVKGIENKSYPYVCYECPN